MLVKKWMRFTGGRVHMKYFNELRSRLEADERLCLLPVSRVLIEEPRWLTPEMVIYPPESIDPNTLRVVSYPAYNYKEIVRRNSVKAPDGSSLLFIEGDDLHWGKSAATGIDLPEFFGSATLAFPVSLDWNAFLFPTSHELHLEMLGAAMARAEEVMDIVRFDYCNLWTPQTLPGRVGLLSDTTFCAGLFYAPEDHESYIIAGQIATHQIISGIGLDMSDVGPVTPVGSGEVGSIFKHGLRLFTAALEAPTETSRFAQMMSLVEYLAAPDSYLLMKKVKGLIARQIASDRADYDAISIDFLYLTSDAKAANGPNHGLRHNIIHCGKRLEDLVRHDERINIFKRLTRYAGVVLEQMRLHGDENWVAIEHLREEAASRLGLVGE
jgi:hypothetical protein